MSHLFDAPLPHRDLRLELSDLFVFDADGATVLVLNVRAAPDGHEHLEVLHPGGRYEFKIHFDGHEREELTYRVAFSSAQGGLQAYVVERLTGSAAFDDAALGRVIAEGDIGQAAQTQDGGRVWVGEAVDPFFLDLRQLRDVQRVVQRGEEADLTRWVRGIAVDSFAGSVVRSIVLTVPEEVDGLTTGRHVCVWATSKLPTDAAGGWRQVTRTALPLFGSIFRPTGDPDAARADHAHPADDPERYGPKIADMVSSTVERLGTSQRPGAYADSVVERIVADVLRYVVRSPAVFGFARFNGRRLTDNAAEAMFSLVTNAAVPTGLGSADATRSQEAFPYVIPVDAPRVGVRSSGTTS